MRNKRIRIYWDRDIDSEYRGSWGIVIFNIWMHHDTFIEAHRRYKPFYVDHVPTYKAAIDAFRNA